MTPKTNRWQQLPTKKKLMILYLVFLPFIAYGFLEYFQQQSDFEDNLDNITIDMMSCETIDKAIYLNSISMSKSEKMDTVMVNLWFEGNCENPDSLYWRGEEWTPTINEHVK